MTFLRRTRISRPLPANPAGDPAVALRLAQEAMTQTGTVIDANGRRRRLTAEEAAPAIAALERCARALAADRLAPRTGG